MDSPAATLAGKKARRDVAAAREVQTQVDRPRVVVDDRRSSCPFAPHATSGSSEADLGRTLRHWRDTFLAYFTTHRANNGGTKAVNGIIEQHRHLARGHRNRDSYGLGMLLAAGSLTP